MRLLSAFVVASDDVTWATVVVALAAGAIGSVLTGLVAFGGRLTRIGREIEANDRALRIEDRHLETWVSDATIALVRELRTIRSELSARGAFNSGEYGYQLGLAKERALHAYRDQERTSQSRADEIRAREGSVHNLLRAWRFKTLDLELRAPERVRPILDRWAAPPTQHLSSTDEPQPIADPRTRTVDSTLAFLDNDPKALT